MPRRGSTSTPATRWSSGSSRRRQRTARPGTMAGLGGFGALFDLKAAGYCDPILVAATDGVGTKLRIAIDTGLVDGIGIDLVAMCVNDLVCQGAEPLHVPRLFRHRQARCRAGGADHRRHRARLRARPAPRWSAARPPRCRGCTTAAISTLPASRSARWSAAPSCPPGSAEGDVLLGLASDGVHSNGYSLVRRIVEVSGLGWDAPAPFAAGSAGRGAAGPDPALRPPGAGGDPRRRGPCAGPYHRRRADREPAAGAARGPRLPGSILPRCRCRRCSAGCDATGGVAPRPRC